MSRLQAPRHCQLEFTYAGQHMSELSSANQQITVQHHGGRGYLAKQVATENLDAEKIASFEFEKQKAARSEALGLYSPISAETAKQFAIAPKDGAAPTLYDLLADKNGSINKYGYQTKFQQVHDRLRAGDLTEEQTKAVNDLWINWGDAAKNPLKDSRTGNISADSIKKATGESVDGIRQAAKDRQTIQNTAMQADRQLPHNFDFNGEQMIRLDSLWTRQIEAAFAPELITLDGRSLVEQARQILKSESKDAHKSVSDQDARALVAAIAKANKFPGSGQQWQAFVRDGKQSHLPKSLNQLLHRGLQLALPTDR